MSADRECTGTHAGEGYTESSRPANVGINRSSCSDVACPENHRCSGPCGRLLYNILWTTYTTTTVLCCVTRTPAANTIELYSKYYYCTVRNQQAFVLIVCESSRRITQTLFSIEASLDGGASRSTFAVLRISRFGRPYQWSQRQRVRSSTVLIVVVVVVRSLI